MEQLMEKFDEILDTWQDLPEYVYSDEYRDAFIKFTKKKIAVGQEIKPLLAVMVLHHETGERLPYFDFNRG